MGPRVVALLAVACGSAVANVYFAQPLLPALGRDLAIGSGALGAVVTVTQVGYGLGLFLLVPLGDVVDRRRLAVAQTLALAAALAVVGAAPDAAVLLAGVAAVGLLAVVAQTLVAFAAALTAPERRGRVVGLVTGGIVTGILLARAVAGVLADLAGWRAVYLASAAVTGVLAFALHRVLPSQELPPAPGYGRLLRSTVALFVREPALRLRGVLALLVFAAFSTLWSCVALPLSARGLSPAAIGAFGLAGAAGALAAPLAGRLGDRGRAAWTTSAGLVLLTASWLPLAFTGSSLWALAAGVVMLDFAVQAVHVTSQSVIYAARPGARVIGGYMIFYSAGSASGALAATALYAAAGWGAVCALGAGLSAAALAVWAATACAPRRPSTARPAGAARRTPPDASAAATPPPAPPAPGRAA
ncbi:Inner membrane transport protein YnfM [Actinomadura rubteroloni]|uniref:Inner membrane transport protein YnfM n=1 Tax=Actinomadura rubteroloni TaxID=1926885 RepID=A0A2P4UQT1_9ACTN|nr:Inner membrane transport protein YnfM [Actinomadura rubteroloni]